MIAQTISKSTFRTDCVFNFQGFHSGTYTDNNGDPWAGIVGNAGVSSEDEGTDNDNGED